MSQWTEIPKEDIEVDGDELNILIGDDDSGNIYVTVKIKDVLDLIEQGEK